MKTLKTFGLLLYAILLSMASYAQRNDLLLTNSQSITENPYEGIEGSPFYFDNWQKGKIYPISDKEPIEEVLLNFNGYTQSFEIKKDSRYIALDEQWYTTVEIEKDGTLLSYKKGLLPKHNNQFTRLVFQGNSFQVVQDFTVSLLTREQQEYAKVKEVQRFNSHRNYYLIKNGKSKLLKLKKKAILGFFPRHKTTLEKYAKKKRLKWSSEKDMIHLFQYYEELTHSDALSSTGEG